MSLTVADLNTELNTYFGDTSTDVITAAQRLGFNTEAVVWLQTELDNDHSIRTYTVNYLDTLNYYKLNSAVTDIFEANELRRAVGENDKPITRKSPEELSEDIANDSTESAFALERRDGNIYLAVNHSSRYGALQVTQFDSLTADGGTWQADTTNSDATNLAVDTADGSTPYADGCLSFDVDVSQSVNNRATIYNDDLNDGDLTEDKDLSTWLLDIKFPEITNISSVTLYWGSSSANYYSVTSTTDVQGSSFVADWNTLKFAWLGATVTGTPDVEVINYIRIDVNYAGGQTDATSFKLDNLRLVRPEKLTFHYSSWNVGTDNAGAQLKKFAATTDIPYFSGQYDHYKFAVGHKAASLAFKSVRLYAEADKEEIEALKEVSKYKQIIPKSRKPEMKSFKVQGVRLGRKYGRRFA